MTTPIWQGKEIKDLTNAELVDASFKLEAMNNFTLAKREHPKFAKKFKNQPLPDTNPAFEALKTEVEKEIKTRNI